MLATVVPHPISRSHLSWLAMGRKVSRRRLLAGSGLAVVAAVTAGVALVDAGVLPGQSVLNDVLGRCDVAVPPVSALPGPVVDGGFDSVLRRTRVGFRLAYPRALRPEPGFRCAWSCTGTARTPPG
jgi:hypothetical protein